MKVLITGGAGFIGTHLTERLVAEDHQVVILDSLSPQVHAHAGFAPSLETKARCVKGSVTDARLVERLLGEVEAVVHLAAETGTAQSMYSGARYCDTNVTGTATFLDAIVNGRGGVRRVVLASSRAVYGEGQYRCENCGVVHPRARRPADLERRVWSVFCPGCGRAVTAIPTGEDAELSPASVYASNKQSQEQLVQIVAGATGLEAVILRYQNVYGPGQSLSNPYTGVICTFYNQVAAGVPLNVYEDGEIRRDFVYIDDVVAATAAALTAPAAAGQAEVINVGSGVSTSILEVAGMLYRVLDREPDIRVSGNYRLGDIRECFADVTRLATVLGLRPEVSLEAGIRRFAAWAAGSESFQQGVQAAARAARELEERNLLR